ncbi:MAG: HAMP domain-containing protein [Oligoflexales bacterium]|nr:HAMP domain-containing protein [Oligoflexales bacterium]
MLFERIPIRFRLSLLHTLWMSLVFLSIGAGVYRIVEDTLYQSIDATLLATSKAINNFKGQAPRNRPFDHPLHNFFFREHFSFSNQSAPFLGNLFGQNIIRPYAQIIDLSGKITAKSSNVALPVSANAISRAKLGLSTLETYSLFDSTFREITYPLMQAGRFTGELIQVATSLEPTQQTLLGVRTVLWSAMPAGLLLTMFFGYRLTKQSLRPVRSISAAAANLHANELGEKLPVPIANDELKELTLTFNAMLDRMGDAFKRLRFFSSNVSHELRTPLAVMQAEAELALRRQRSAEEYRAALTAIVKETKHMSEIIEDLLLLAKAQSGSVAVQWVKINAMQHLQELKKSIQPLLDEKSIDFRIQSNGVEFYCGAPNYLNLAIKNLVVNAVKHSEKNGVITLDLWQKDKTINIRVKDSGEGIPEEALPYIFDPFYRVDDARNRSTGGTGIGLCLTLALIKLHQGEINVYSKVGEGAEFVISLPIHLPPNSVS